MNKTKTVIHFVMAFMVVAGLISCKVEPETGDIDISKTSETLTEKDTTAPSSVKGLDINFGEEGELLLTWTDPEDKDLYAIKLYYPVDENGMLYRSTGGYLRKAVSLDDGFLVNKGTQSYKFTGLPVPETYTFKVSAVDESLNESAFEQTRVQLPKRNKSDILIVPASVTSPSAECVDGIMKISWKNPSEYEYVHNEDKFWGVKITASPANGAFAAPVYVKSYAGYESSETFECKNLIDGDIYSFTITALDTALHEGFRVTSNQVKFIEKIKSEEDDTVPPGVVTSGKIIAGDKKIVLSWTNPSDDDFYGTRIKVRATKQNVNEEIPIPDPIVIEGNPSETSSAVFEGLKNGIRYSFYLYALDKNQNESHYVVLRDYPTDTSDKIAPAEVTEFNVTASDGNALLAWKNPADSDFAGVKISGTPSEGTLSNPVVLGKEAESLIISGLTTGGMYEFKIQTFDNSLNFSDGTSVENIEVSNSTDYTAPAEVTEFNVTASDGNALLTWKNPADSDFAGVKISGTPSEGTLSNPVVLGKEAENLIISGLKTGETYTFKIQTFDNSLNMSEGLSRNELVNISSPVIFESFLIPNAGIAKKGNPVTAILKGKNFTSQFFEITCPENPEVTNYIALKFHSDSMISVSLTIPSEPKNYTVYVKSGGKSITGEFCVKDYSDYDYSKIGYIILADGTFVNPDLYDSIDSENPPVAIYAGLNDNGAVIGVGLHKSSERLMWESENNPFYSQCIEDIKCKWSFRRVVGTNHFYISNIEYWEGDMFGFDNWDLMCCADSFGTEESAVNYPAFDWANHYNSNYKNYLGNSSEGWYMPSVKELSIVIDYFSEKINSSCAKIYGFENGSDYSDETIILDDEKYWSSSQWGGIINGTWYDYTLRAGGCCANDTSVSEGKGDSIFADFKKNTFYVLVVKTF